MKKLILIGAASLAFTTAAHATNIPDGDTSSNSAASYTTTSNGDNLDEASATESRSYTLSGQVTKACVFSGMDSNQNAAIDLGTIGIVADDDSSIGNQFKMNGGFSVDIKHNWAGCNYKNNVKVEKSNGVPGLKNASAAGSGYDASVFQANIPYTAAVTFSAPPVGSTTATGQNVTAGVGDASKDGNFGAWLSQLDLTVSATTTPLALVGGTYTDTVTLTLKII